MMTTIKDISLLVTDGKHGDCQDEHGSGFYFVSCKDVKDGWIDYSGARQITESDYLDTHRRTQLEVNDIVITNSGTIGRMALVPNAPETYRTTFQKSVAIIKPNQENVAPQWLYYSLMANREALTAWAGGTAQKNLLLRDLRAFNVEVPPLPTQRKIAAILSAYDDLIENNLRRIKILEEMAQNLYREWFVKFRFPGHQHARFTDSPLGRIPEGWEVKSLGQLADQIRDGINPDWVDPETPYFGLEHLPRKSITLSAWGIASEVQSTKLLFKKGDILFGKIRPYFHKVGVAPLSGVCSSDTIVIRPRSVDWFGLVLGCTSSAEFVEHATATSQGTKMPRANWNVLVNYRIPMAPQPILGHYNEFISEIVSQLHNFVFRNQTLRRTRDLLLPRLISGEVDVSELDIAVPEEAL
jgi:type I restriction enzyme, S subunit